MSGPTLCFAEMFILPWPFTVAAVVGVVLLIAWGIRRDRPDPPEPK